MRVGFGYDVHRLVRGRKLYLGGEFIPFKKGLLGHSDADVLIHSICDAILGAAGLSDIGTHFPDSDPSFKDIQSTLLLMKVCEMIRDKDFSISNIDSTIIAQKPQLSPYRNAMKKNVASCTDLDLKDVNVKFTTTEGLGIIGKGNAIAAACVVLIE